jgi:stage V sporulation protein AA
MECTNAAALRQLKQKKVYTFPEAAESRKQKNEMQVFSVLKIIELIHEEYPGLTISNEGEKDFIVEYIPDPAKPVWLNALKTAVLCVVIFFGAAFTIMAFNNDISIGDVFAKLYFQVTGNKANGVTELEVCYSIGLALGILIFFNHVGHKKITPDPTPIQVEMRKYEKDIDTTFIENAERKGHSIDIR